MSEEYFSSQKLQIRPIPYLFGASVGLLLARVFGRPSWLAISSPLLLPVALILVAVLWSVISHVMDKVSHKDEPPGPKEIRI